MGEKNTHTYQCKCLKIVETQCKNQGISNMVKKEACTKCCEGCQNNDGGVAKRCEFCGAVRGAVTLFLYVYLKTSSFWPFRVEIYIYIDIHNKKTRSDKFNCKKTCGKLEHKNDLIILNQEYEGKSSISEYNNFQERIVLATWNNISSSPRFP